MKTRTILAAVGLLILMVATPASMAAKDETVTLEITGSHDSLREVSGKVVCDR